MSQFRPPRDPPKDPKGMRLMSGCALKSSVNSGRWGVHSFRAEPRGTCDPNLTRLVGPLETVGRIAMPLLGISGTMSGQEMAGVRNAEAVPLDPMTARQFIPMT